MKIAAALGENAILNGREPVTAERQRMNIHASARFIRKTTPAQLRHHTFPSGSMGPEVNAACAFVENTMKRAAIGAFVKVEEIVAGIAGAEVWQDRVDI